MIAGDLEDLAGRSRSGLARQRTACSTTGPVRSAQPIKVDKARMITLFIFISAS
jgi:hypothetical protein